MTQFNTPTGGVGGFLSRLLSGIAQGGQRGLAIGQQRAEEERIKLEDEERERTRQVLQQAIIRVCHSIR